MVKEKGVDLLLDSRVILAVSKDFGISREVIVKADDAERAAKAKAPAAAAPGPKAPEKPAAAPPKP